MRRWTGLVIAVLVVAPLIATTPLAAKNPKPKAGGGNSSAAHTCHHGGYRSLVGADGTTFKNTGACVRFRAHGGAFATGIIIPAGKIATPVERALDTDPVRQAHVRLPAESRNQRPARQQGWWPVYQWCAAGRDDRAVPDGDAASHLPERHGHSAGTQLQLHVLLGRVARTRYRG